MNFDEVEGLTEEQIFQLYDSVIEGDFISSNVYFIRCDNGTSGYYLQQGNFSDAYRVGSFGYIRGDKPGAIYYVCGQGQWGYAQLIANGLPEPANDDYSTFAVWYVKCTNGNEGQDLWQWGDNQVEVGRTFYNYTNFTSIAHVCGDMGEYGYLHLLANSRYNIR